MQRKKERPVVKETFAKSAITTTNNDPEVIKFVSAFPKGFIFTLPIVDENGKQVYQFDANGEKKLPQFKQYSFTPFVERDRHGKIDADGGYSFFITSEALHGEDHPRIMKRLNELKSNPMNKLCMEDDHFKKRNPHAFAVTEQLNEKEKIIAERDARIKALEEKLGFKQSGSTTEG